MTKYIEYKCYGTRAQIFRFLKQATSTETKSAILKIFVDKEGLYTSDSDYLYLPFERAYYENAGCEVPDSCVYEQGDSDALLSGFNAKCTYQFSELFESATYWLEAVASSMASKKVAFAFDLLAPERSGSQAWVVKSLTVYSYLKADIDNFTEAYVNKGVNKKQILGCSNAGGLSLQQLESMLTNYPNRQRNASHDDLIRPPLLNRYGKPAQLEMLPSFYDCPASVWKGSAAMDFCNNYVNYLTKANRLVKYVGVASPHLTLPEIHFHNEYSLQNAFDPIAFGYQLRQHDLELGADEVIRGMLAGFATDSILRIWDANAMTEKNQWLLGHMISQYFEKHNFECISIGLAKLIETERTRFDQEQLAVLDKLHSHFDQLEPAENYTLLFEKLSQNEDKIIFRANKDNHADHCSVAMIFSFVWAQKQWQEKTDSHCFKLPATTLLLHVDLVTSMANPEFFNCLRRVRTYMIAPFIVIDKEEHEFLKHHVVHHIEAASGPGEFNVRFYNDEFGVRTSS